MIDYTIIMVNVLSCREVIGKVVGKVCKVTAFLCEIM